MLTRISLSIHNLFVFHLFHYSLTTTTTAAASRATAKCVVATHTSLTSSE